MVSVTRQLIFNTVQLELEHLMPLWWRTLSPRNFFKNSYYTHRSASAIMPASSKAHARKPSEEIVDDSEPERAELRRRQRKSSVESSNPRSNSAKRPAPPFQNTTIYKHIPDVIEISDSDSELSCSYNHLMSSDPRFHVTPSPRNVSPTNIPESSNRIGVCAEEGFMSTAGRQPLSSILRADQESPIPSTSKTAFIDTKRFAYTSTTAVKKSATLPPRCTDTTAPPQKRKNTSFDLPNVDLSKVSRCVCCELSWTVRKSGPQKLSHIRTCAKKHGFTEETVMVLLQKEVSDYVQPSKQTVKTQAKAPAITEPGPSKKTYLEELVGVPPKKKTKHREAENRLANISVTRDSILARAHGILCDPSSSGFETVTNDSIMNDLPKQPLIDASHGDMPPATQAFGHSDLARLPGLASRTSLFNINTSPARADFLNGETAHRSVHTQQHSLDQPYSLGTPLLPHDLRISQKDVPSHMASHQNGLKEISDHGELTNISGIRSKATRGASSPSRQTSLTRPSPKLTPKKRRKGVRLPSPSLDDALARLSLGSTPQQAKKPTKPRTPKTMVRQEKAVFGAEWEAHMKMHILRDSELHLQILRYQPIHFDVFLEFAKLYAPLNGKLKLQLQIFLDQQAILFFGGNTWKR